MVGIVIVSHSRPLAEAVAALARQAAPGASLSIGVAAGVGDQRAEFGTDAVEIAGAIQSADDPSGVVVLMDLGSAVLSAEAALDLVPDGMRARVRLCPAPLVEGAIAAASRAAAGSGLEAVCQEAAQALASKLEQLSPGEAQDQPESGRAAQEIAADTAQATATLVNPHGLHARPAARLVQAAAAFDAEVSVRKLDSPRPAVSARSLSQLMMLGAGQGDRVMLTARGRQAAEAAQALARLIAEGLGEGSGESRAEQPGAAPAAVPAPAGAAALRGQPVSDGYATGPVQHYRHPDAAVSEEEAGDAALELKQLDDAIARVCQAIGQRRRQVGAAFGEAKAGIFDAHRLILEDPALVERARQTIRQSHRRAAWAWRAAMNGVAAEYRALEDPYLRQRAADVEDVGRQVLAVLVPGDAPGAGASPASPAGGILVAEDLTPTQVAGLDAERVLGIVTVAGGASSHAAILVRALGLPAVTGVDPSVLAVPDGTPAAIDGRDGAVWINPPADHLAGVEKQRAAWLGQARRLRAASRQDTYTRDGRRVEVAANLGSVADAAAAVANGAEAVGVLRTEFLYLTRPQAATEDDQVAMLRQIAGALHPRPVIVRTLDVGGDKAIPYLPLPVEANPFLGVRAIRLSFQHPGLFVTQVKAILRAGADHELRILLPMVSLVEEIGRARQLIEQAHAELAAQGAVHRWPMPLGIMIETPSAALLADAMAARVDFLSIGTNDLTQYTLAAERGNTGVQYLSDALHPSVLRLIRGVAEAARAHRRWSGVCGEIASDPIAVPLLVGLGVDELSLNPAAIPRVKAVIRGLDMPAATALAEAALKMETAAAVRGLAQAFAEDMSRRATAA